jgi:hypothetical protein
MWKEKPPVAIVAAIGSQGEQEKKGPFQETPFVRRPHVLATAARAKLLLRHKTLSAAEEF